MAVALFALALWSASHPPPSLARPARLDVRGRIVTIGASPNLLAPGPVAGTFLLGDLDSGWMTLRRSVDGQGAAGRAAAGGIEGGVEVDEWTHPEPS